MGLQLVTLRSWLIERVRIMPAPLLVLVFMILINIHQSGIKNQVSEGFHDLKIILNIECNAQMFAAESWASPHLCAAHVLMFRCSQCQDTSPSISVIFDLIKISAEFITAVQMLQAAALCGTSIFSSPDATIRVAGCLHQPIRGHGWPKK